MFTFKQTVAALDEVIAEVGEGYLYPEAERIYSGIHGEYICAYIHNGKPSCIVGRAVRKLIPDARFVELSNPNMQSWSDQFDKRSLAVLHSVQEKQDLGYSFGNSVAHAKKSKW